MRPHQTCAVHSFIKFCNIIHIGLGIVCCLFTQFKFFKTLSIVGTVTVIGLDLSFN